jgi:hypothetical protein
MNAILPQHSLYADMARCLGSFIPTYYLRTYCKHLNRNSFQHTYLIRIFRHICNSTAKCPKAFCCKAFQMPQCPFFKLLTFCSKSEFLKKIHPYTRFCSKIPNESDGGILRLRSFWALSIVRYSVTAYISLGGGGGAAEIKPIGRGGQ